MPRGKKGSRNFEAEISALDEKIARYKTMIKNLEEKKDALENDRRSAEMKEVYSAMSEKGMSPKDVLDLLDKT